MATEFAWRGIPNSNIKTKTKAKKKTKTKTMKKKKTKLLFLLLLYFIFTYLLYSIFTNGIYFGWEIALQPFFFSLMNCILLGDWAGPKFFILKIRT